MGNLARHRYTCWGRMHPPELYTSAEAPAPSCSFCKPCHQDSKLAPRLHEGGTGQRLLSAAAGFAAGVLLLLVLGLPGK